MKYSNREIADLFGLTLGQIKYAVRKIVYFHDGNYRFPNPR